MRKVFLPLIAIVFVVYYLPGQVTMIMEVPVDAAPCNGEETCIDVKTMDFSDVTNMRFDIVWDANVFSFVGIQGFNPLVTGLDAADFDLSNAAAGRISLDWRLVDCNEPNTSGITLDDCMGNCLPSLFQLCLESIGSYGAVSEVLIPATDPVPYITKSNALCNNTFLEPIPGILSTCVRPVHLYVTNEMAEEGSEVCVQIKVNGFDELTSMQFTMQWDNSILEFASISPNSSEIPSLNIGNFGLPDEPNVPDNRITFSWSYVLPSNQGWTVPDSTTLFTVCFNVIGECETFSPVEIIDEGSPFNVEVRNVTDFLIYTIRTPGSVTVGRCEPPGLVLIDAQGNVGIGTPTPASRLQIADGDIFIEDIQRGVIMRAPNGNCWRLRIDNNGDWVKTQIDCPN
jgi:hypothetical protein